MNDPSLGRPLRHQPTSAKSKETAALLWFFLGWAGAHRMYLGNITVGIGYLLLSIFTCGLGGVVGWVDGFLLLLRSPKDEYGLPVVWSWNKGKLFVDPLEEGTFEPAESRARILFHFGLLFLMPYLVVSAGLSLFETSEVKETLPKVALYAGALLVPLFLLQLLGTIRKARAQIGMLRKAGALTKRTRLDAIARAASIVTPRGALVLVTGLVFLLLSLAYKWAELGVIAVLSLSAFYLVTSAAALLSSFVVQRFASSLLERGAALHRRYEPGVVRSGEAVLDRLDLRGVPVPPGFFLTLQGILPPRLETEVRHVVPPRGRGERLTLDAQLKRTPRGSYEAPALRVAFTDLLGLTSAPVASLATARLRVLPSVRPAEVITPPQSSTEEPDILSRPHRFPTDDLFRFREYVAGDDTRRIHWRLSMRARKMIVKTPDSRETSARRVVVALDTWVPPGWLDHTAVIDDALDSLVEAWLAIAQRLVQQGEKATLLVVARGEDGRIRHELVACGTANHAHWLDAGARAEWQAQMPIENVLDWGVQQGDAASGEGVAFDNAIVVTMRLAPPQMPRVARETTWVWYDPDDALGPSPKTAYRTWLDDDDTGREPTGRMLLRRAMLLPYPVGAEENGLFARMGRLERRLEDRAHRLALRRMAVASGRQALDGLMALPDAVYKLEVKDGRHRLVGMKGSTRGPRASDRYEAQRTGAVR